MSVALAPGMLLLGLFMPTCDDDLAFAFWAVPTAVRRHADTLRYAFCGVGALALLANYLITR